jgi:hypothetical protein
VEITRRQLKGIILQEIFGKKKSEEENYVESFNKFTNLDHAPFKMEISVEDLEDVLETPDGRIMTTGIVPGRLTGDTQSTATDIAKDRLARHALNVPSGDLEVGMYGAVPIYINPSPDKRFKNTTFVTVAIEPRNIIKK